MRQPCTVLVFHLSKPCLPLLIKPTSFTLDRGIKQKVLTVFKIAFHRLENKQFFRASRVGTVVENLPANAGNTGSSPGLGRSHMLQSNWAHEPQLLSLHVWSLCSATREAVIVRGPCTAMKSGPRLPQLEKALAQKRRPNTAKNKKIKNSFTFFFHSGLFIQPKFME